MGLMLMGQQSEREYHYSYEGLHFIRYLAVKIEGFKGSYKNSLKETGNFKKYKRFHQLLHFSDCDGILLPDSLLRDSDISESFYIGSSGKLLKELEIIKKYLLKNKIKYLKIEGERDYEPLHCFWDLYALVYDEVNHGSGIITFA